MSSILSLLKDRYKRNWCILVLIWIFGAILFYLNVRKIDRYIEKRRIKEENEYIENFLKNHMRKIKQIMEKKEKLYDRISNLNLGIIKVEEYVEDIAKKEGIKVKGIRHEKGNGKIFFEISCSGDVSDLIGFIYELESIWYFRILRLDLDLTDNGKYKITFSYNYRII